MNERMISYWFLLSSIFFLSVVKELGYFCLIISVILYWREKKEKCEKNTIDWLVIAYLVMTILSCVFNWSNDYVDHGRLLKGVQMTTIGLIYYFLVKHYFSTKQEIRSLVVVLLLQGIVIAIYGLWHYKGIMGLRMASTLIGPNLLATHLNVLLAFVMLYFFNAEKWGQRILAGFEIILLTICLLLTLSRGGWIAFLCLFLGFSIWQSRKILPWIVGSGFLVVLLVFNSIRERAASIFSLSNPSNLQRFYIWDAAWEMIREHPFWGIGPSQYRYLYGDFVQKGSPFEGDIFAHAHNIFLNIFCERGFFTLAVFVLLLGFVFHYGYQLLKAERMDGHTSNIVVVCLLAILTICMTGMFDDSFALHSNFYMLMMLFALVQRKKE